MIKKLITWIYLRVVYLPEFKKKVEAAYPDANITYTTRIEEDPVLPDRELEGRIMRQAWFERERIPDDHLH